MDNRGTPAPSNSQIRPNRDALFPNRRGTQNVKDPEALSRRIYTEAENFADENNRAIPIVISSGSEDDSDDDAAYEEAERQRKGKMVVPASKAEPKQKRRAAAPDIPSCIVIKEQENGEFIEKEYQRRLNGAKLESLNTQNVEAPEPSEAEQSKGKAAEHDIPLGAEYERQLDIAIQESLKSYYNNLAGRSLDAHALARGYIGNDSTSNPAMELANVSHCPNDASVDEGAQTEAHDAVRGAEYERQLDIAIQESLKSYYNNSAGRSLDAHALARGYIGNDSTSNPAMELANVSHCPNDASVDEGAQTEALDAVRGAEYKRQLKFAIQESLKSYYNNSAGRSLDAHALRTETGLVRGNIGNEDSVDEGAQTEAIDAVRGNESPKGKRKIKAKKQKIAEPDVARGNIINSSGDTEPTGSMPHQGVSSRGRLLKPTSKLLQLDAPLPLNRGPRRSYRRHGSQQNRLQSGVAGVSEGSGSVVSKAGQANGVARQADVVNPDGSGVGGEVGGSEPDEDYWIPDLIVVPFYDPTSVAGQASEANAVGRQTDMVVPLLEPMVCVTNQNPMDFTVEEAKKYMRTE